MTKGRKILVLENSFSERNRENNEFIYLRVRVDN